MRKQGQMQSPCISNSNLERLEVMKKIYVAIAVLVAAALTSCQQEQSFEDSNLGENGIAFVLQGGATRAAETSTLETPGISIDIAQVGNQTLYMEETITDLNGFLPETKGTPIYTENVGKIDAYKEMIVNIPDKGGDASYESMDASLTYDHIKGDPDQGKGWRYQHNYPASIWPTGDNAGDEVPFYFRMPASMSGATFATNAHANGKTTFTYTSPTTAATQQDILFSYVSVNKENYKKALPNGYPVMMYHALSGIKFAISNELVNGALEMGIQITGISFIGVKNTGTCTVNAGASAIADKIAWNNVSATETTNVMSQAFAPADNVVTYTDSMFPDSFDATGTIDGNNKTVSGSEINHAGDAAYTFWIIPQSFDANSKAKIRIDYKINGNTEYMEILLNKIAKAAWGAGQLRTFTFKLNDVNVKIEDTVTLKNASDDTNPYTQSVKSNVIITNTGNTDAYIRAAIVGQWLSSVKDANTNVGDIVFGFTDAIGRLDLVESWYEDQFVNGTHNHGEFVGLAGYKNSGTSGNTSGTNPYNGWTLCEDGYYYYTTAVNPKGTTAALFDSYTIKSVPTPTYGGQVWEKDHVYFTLEIATQAISANDAEKMDGSNYSWDVAWEKATGNKPVQK